MPLKYALIENTLPPNLDSYLARVRNVKSHDLESIIDLMLQRGSTITHTDILAVNNSLSEEIIRLAARGEAISTSLFQLSFSITGVFNSPTDTFDPARHEVKIHLTPGKALKAAVKNIKLRKVTPPSNLPYVAQVTDSVSESVNSQITSAGVLEINGSLLKIEGDHPNNGVYLIAKDGTQHKVQTLVSNKPSRLIVLLPTLTPGSYTLQITTQYNGGMGLKSPRTGVFRQTLTVA